jgi:hypothetical protein
MDEEGSPGPCKMCPIGRYITDSKLAEMHTSLDSCIICQAGTYAENVGSNECTKCQRGTYLQDSSNDESEHARADQCVSCQKGSFSDIGAKECMACGAGKYANETGSTSCKKCAAGKFLIHGSIQDQINYPNYHDSIDDCVPCKIGYYAGMVGSTECTICRGGTTDSEGATACGACPHGYDCSGVKNVLCSKGNYSDGDGVCKICMAGHYCPGGTGEIYKQVALQLIVQA